MRILLTGPSGFLGRSLFKFWSQQRHELFLLARPNSRLETLGRLPASVKIIRANKPIDIFNEVRTIRPDVIVHTACSYGRKGESSLDMIEANMHFGSILLDALQGMPTFAGEPAIFLNTATVLDPEVSLYALSKSMFSKWGHAIALKSSSRVKFIDVKLQQMYGPGDDPTKFTTFVIEALSNNVQELELTTGDQSRDLIYIDDVVRAYNKILLNRSIFKNSDVVELGSGEVITIKNYVEMVKKLANANTELKFGKIPYRDNEAMYSIANTEKLNELGWSPQVTLESGIMESLRYVKSL